VSPKDEESNRILGRVLRGATPPGRHVALETKNRQHFSASTMRCRFATDSHKPKWRREEERGESAVKAKRRKESWGRGRERTGVTYGVKSRRRVAKKAGDGSRALEEGRRQSTPCWGQSHEIEKVKTDSGFIVLAKPNLRTEAKFETEEERQRNPRIKTKWTCHRSLAVE